MKWRKKMALEVTDATFAEETKEGLVLIDFWATWCGPCRMQAPILEQLSQEIDEDELKILKMDVDENPETARQFGIMSIPTLMFKKDGEVVKQVAGVHTKDQLKAIIAELS
ncbi:TPA: thioredoxin [Streptococcus agalactiae]